MPPSPRRRRRRWPLWVLVAAVVLGCYAAVSVVRLQRADHRLQAARADIAGLKAQLGKGVGLGDPRATAGLDAAAVAARSASAEVHGGWWAPIGVVPVASRQLSSVQHLAAAAATATASGDAAIHQVQAALAGNHSGPAGRAALLDAVAVATARLQRSLDGIDLGPRTDLLAPLARSYDQVASELASVRAGVGRSSSATTAASRLLAGPSTYLVLAGNNAEMRDGAGMYLQAGTVTFDHGQVTAGQFTPTEALSADQPAAAPTGTPGALWPTRAVGQEWRNLALTPQFPDTAATAASMWQARGNQAVDGVFSIDVAGLADLLAATGPVTVDGTTYTSSTVTRQLLVDEYAGVTINSQADVARLQRIGKLAGAVFASLQGAGSVTSAVTPLDDAVNGRHLMVWSRDAGMEAAWRAAGVAGAVPADGLMIGLLNQGQNKLDPFMHLAAAFATAPAAGGGTRVTVTVTVANQAPDALSPYQAAGGQGRPYEYDGAVAFELPSAAGDIVGTGGIDVEAAGADGATLEYARSVAVPKGTEATVQVAFTVLGAHGALQLQPSARIPPTAWTDGPRHLDDASAHALRW